MKNKLVLLFSIIILFYGNANSDNINGYWKGEMEMSGKTIDISIEINTDSQLFSSYDLMLLDIPITKLKFQDEKISFTVALDIDLVFTGRISSNNIIGTSTIIGGPPNMNITYILTKQSNNHSKPYSIETLFIESDNVLLSARIYKPHTKGLHPAIVLLHGSSINLKRNYIFEADYFAKLGFEVLIFDKRGCGNSTGNYYLSIYDDFIVDAISCLEIMQKRESIDKNKIGLWGFSQGAMLLPKVASQTNIPKFIIAKSPEVINVTEAAAFSDSLNIINSGHSILNAQFAAESQRIVRRMIQKGESYKNLEIFIQQNARNNNFMNQTGLYEDLNIDKDEYMGFYWQGRTENFIDYWEDIKIPTLILFGERDSFVNAIKNLSMLQDLKNDNIDIILFPIANHNLKKSLNPAIDNDFDWPRIIEGYLDSIDEWLKLHL